MKVCILGSGVMGTGIVSLFAQSNSVTSIAWWSRDHHSIEKSYVRVKKELLRFSKKSKLTPEETEMLLSKVTFSTELSELSDCNVYVEAIVEDLATKTQLISDLSEYISEDAIVATNTSSLSVTALSMSINEPSNFVGMHFFNPTSIMRLVEVVKGLTTSEETLTKVIKLVEQLGKKPVVVNESPGFIVNRMLIPMINEAIAVLAEGVASKEDIDNAMKFGANHPIGPISLADLIGNDVCLSIMETLHNETGDPKYRAHSLLRQYVRAGYLGRKVGVGFYEY